MLFHHCTKIVDLSHLIEAHDALNFFAVFMPKRETSMSLFKSKSKTGNGKCANLFKNVWLRVAPANTYILCMF